MVFHFYFPSSHPGMIGTDFSLAGWTDARSPLSPVWFNKKKQSSEKEGCLG